MTRDYRKPWRSSPSALQRSNERIAELESEVSAFLREVDDVVDRLDNSFGLGAKAAA
jgi:hypothetical protein